MEALMAWGKENKTMGAMRNVFCIAFYKIRRWRSNYRVWFIAVYVLFFDWRFSRNLLPACELAGQKVGPFALSLLLNDFVFFLYLLIPLVILFCDAPFIDSTQPYIIARSKRRVWAWGQVVYIALSSFFYYLYLVLVLFLLNWRCLEQTGGWGGFVENPDAGVYLSSFYGNFNVIEEVVKNFTPFQSMCWSFLAFWFGGILVGLLIFFFNSVTSSRIAGTVFAAVQVTFVYIAYDFPVCYKAALLSWLSAQYMFGGRRSFYFTDPVEVMAVYLVLFAVLITLIMVQNRKRTIEVLPPV